MEKRIRKTKKDLMADLAAEKLGHQITAKTIKKTLEENEKLKSQVKDLKKNKGITAVIESGHELMKEIKEYKTQNPIPMHITLGQTVATERDNQYNISELIRDVRGKLWSVFSQPQPEEMRKENGFDLPSDLLNQMKYNNSLSQQNTADLQDLWDYINQYA